MMMLCRTVRCECHVTTLTPTKHAKRKPSSAAPGLASWKTTTYLACLASTTQIISTARPWIADSQSSARRETGHRCSSRIRRPAVISTSERICFAACHETSAQATRLSRRRFESCACCASSITLANCRRHPGFGLRPRLHCNEAIDLSGWCPSPCSFSLTAGRGTVIIACLPEIPSRRLAGLESACQSISCACYRQRRIAAQTRDDLHRFLRSLDFQGAAWDQKLESR